MFFLKLLSDTGHFNVVVYFLHVIQFCFKIAALEHSNYFRKTDSLKLDFYELYKQRYFREYYKYSLKYLKYYYTKIFKILYK